MPFPKGGLLYILLNNECVLRLINFLGWFHAPLWYRIRKATVLVEIVTTRYCYACWCMRVSLCSVKVFLLLDIFFKLFLCLQLRILNLLLQCLQILRYEYTSSLAPCLRLCDKDHRRPIFRLLLRHLPFLYQQLALRHLFDIILLDVAVLARIQPGPREEVILVRKLLQEPLQMYAQCVLPGDVVHAEEVVDSLMRKHQTQLFWADAEVLPLDVPL